MSSALTETFAERRILVTGHTGFKGSWLVAWLQAMGAKVSGIALDPEKGQLNLFEEAALTTDMDSRIGDIRYAEFVKIVLQDLRPEFIFHLAAQSLVRESYIEPVATYATNVMGTVHLLEAARHVPSVRGVLVVTSDKCYENHEWPWAYRENDAMGGHDPYSSSKGCTELATSAYRRSFFHEEGTALIASARAGNVIGGGDWATHRLIPDLVRGAADRKSTVVRNPQATRPWQHVLDGLGGYLMLAHCLLDGRREFADAWNFGPVEHDVVSVRHVTERAQTAWDSIKVQYPDKTGDEPHEANELRLDTGKARSLLKWRPVFGLDEAIDKTITWYRQDYQKEATARDLMNRQIEEYRSRFE